LYEFYYTSTPAGDAPKNVDFTSFYDFRFAEINCVAFNDLCSQHKVSSYPTTILYENGEPISTLKGDKAIDILSVMVEDALEKAKPGTRPAKLRLPKPGDKSAPQPVEDTTVTKHDEAKAAAVPNTNEHEPDLKKNELPTTGAPKVEEPKAEPKQEGVKKVDEPQKAIDLAPSTPEAKPDPTSKPYSSPSPTYIWEPPVPPIKKPSGPVNQQGASVPLTAEDFQRLVTLTQDPWFIKFYAPWCHHCKALAPTWEQLAKEMKGRLNIGEVNCDKEPRLCKDVRIKGYPTMLFFRGGERVEYQGLRGLGDLLQYAKRCIEVSNGVQDVDYDTFKALEEKEPVIFLYFYDHATTTEDFIALERLPMTIMSHARLVKTRDPRLYERFKISTWPRLLVSREGRPTYYPPLSPREMRDTRLLLDWMRSVWLPLVPELTAANAREIMDGKYVVMGILNREDESSFNTAIRELKTAANEWMDRQIQLFRMERQELRDAKQLRIEEAEDRGDERRLRDAKNIRINMNLSRRKEVVFCWVDGVFWQRWLRTTYGVDIKENGERVIINDADVSFPLSPNPTSHKLTPPEPPLLGHHVDREPDRALAHIHPRDAHQDHGQPPQDQAQADHRLHRENLLRHPRLLPRPPLPQLRLRARHRLRRALVVPRSHPAAFPAPQRVPPS